MDSHRKSIQSDTATVRVRVFHKLTVMSSLSADQIFCGPNIFRKIFRPQHLFWENFPTPESCLGKFSGHLSSEIFFQILFSGSRKFLEIFFGLRNIFQEKFLVGKYNILVGLNLEMVVAKGLGGFTPPCMRNTRTRTVAVADRQYIKKS